MIELHSQTSEEITTSAPKSRQAWDGRTQEKPPSFSSMPSRQTGRRNTRRAQLALIADESGPFLIVTGLPEGTAVATAAKGSLRSSKVAGKYSLAKRLSVLPCNKRGQKTERAMSANSRQSIPAASAAPMRLPTLVPAITADVTPAESRALMTPIWASPRTAPPLRASPTRLD